MAYSLNILEEELKNRVRNDFFSDFQNALIIGKIDFCISQSVLGIENSFLWAEAKKGNKYDIYESFIQLIITIGRARTFDSYNPPIFLGAFDAEKIAFLEFHHVIDIFSKNDFNWNVTPSDHSTKEFNDLLKLLKEDLQNNIIIYKFCTESEELKRFIKANFKVSKLSANKISITKNNFVAIYYKWREYVKPSINIPWEKVNKRGIIDADFYLADILSEDNISIKEKLYVLLKNNQYIYNKEIDDDGLISIKYANFKDNQVAHKQFWNKYTRPPKEEFWDYIIERRDLLVEQDIRERKGAFYTPLPWVELSQQYMADYFGENYQDEYYFWDCAAGTGNLLNGLTNKYKIFASTLDQADVDVLKERSSTAKTLLEGNIFQFDFLNDSFDKCPKELQRIIKDEEKRKKLIIYINPPFAEHGNKKQVSGTGKNKSGVAKETAVYNRVKEEIGAASRELFAQFLIRIYKDIPGCHIAQFSKLKTIQSSNFKKFRNSFKAKLQKMFIVPASTFDNVKGKFPIGFFIWDTTYEEALNFSDAEVYDANSSLLGKKRIYCYDNAKFVIEWLRKFYDNSEYIGYLNIAGTDIQHSNCIFISNFLSENAIKEKLYTHINKNNLIQMSIYTTIRHVIEETWINDRDQFLYPFPTWECDQEFKTDCLAYALFNNNIQFKHGTNHWIPFTEHEVDSQGAFESHFMTNYMNGILKQKTISKISQGTLLSDSIESSVPTEPLVFSNKAKALFDAGRELWRYYHSQSNANPNAALYDIKEYFQGRNERGIMNKKSDNTEYNKLIDNLRDNLKILGAKIEPKVYEHGFLLK